MAWANFCLLLFGSKPPLLTGTQNERPVYLFCIFVQKSTCLRVWVVIPFPHRNTRGLPKVPT